MDRHSQGRHALTPEPSGVCRASLAPWTAPDRQHRTDRPNTALPEHRFRPGVQLVHPGGTAGLQLPEAALPVHRGCGIWLCAGHPANATIATAALQVIDRVESPGRQCNPMLASRTQSPLAAGARRRQPWLARCASLACCITSTSQPATWGRRGVNGRSCWRVFWTPPARVLYGIRREGGPVWGRWYLRAQRPPHRRRGRTGGVPGVHSDDPQDASGSVLALLLDRGPTAGHDRVGGDLHPRSAGLRHSPQATTSPPVPAGCSRLKDPPPVHRQHRARRVGAGPSITVDWNTHLYLAGRGFIPTHNCRDNFGQRISLGRLSPQGAMMMWENPAIGVSLRGPAPVGRSPRTRTLDPVEVQCYRFPDMHAPEGSLEAALLEAIRPSESRHPRLVIVPPEQEQDPDGGQAASPTFHDWRERVGPGQ